MTTTLPGTFLSSPKQPPLRTDSLSSSIAKPKPTSPVIQSADDALAARALLETMLSTLKAEDRLGSEEREERREEREGELVDMLAKMSGRVEGLVSGHLTQAYKNQIDFETALTLTFTRALSNLQLALKRTGQNGKDDYHPSWSLDTTPSSSTPPARPPASSTLRRHPAHRLLRRLIHRLRHPQTQSMPLPQTHLPRSSPSLRCSFRSPLVSAPRQDQGTRHPPPPPGPTQKEKELTAELETLKMKAEELAAAKEQLEDGLENLRKQDGSDADRKAAETEEELRIVAD
ncbi:hypothetical protein M422DRAFT_259469 [Sphaerobolus stellatus SS14]|uniref:Uncharacterized protein n=1 Tax=Sphaerobolus stellatus (strain SS14) TaxID=990650 RepID=A0A0C9VJN7_SPHS4|nr:hypothetical protein M422DRAFT_259469 [Sphaerobolus stellatus SS14]